SGENDGEDRCGSNASSVVSFACTTGWSIVVRTNVEFSSAGRDLNSSAMSSLDAILAHSSLFRNSPIVAAMSLLIWERWGRNLPGGHAVERSSRPARFEDSQNRSERAHHPPSAGFPPSRKPTTKSGEYPTMKRQISHDVILTVRSLGAF